MGRLATILLLALIGIDEAFAFDKETHRAISLRAAEIYCACNSFRNCPPGERFAQGAVDEDAEDRLDRLFNWHFLRDLNEPETERLLATTLNRILNKRIRQFEEATISDRWYRAGRVVHFIQDMAVPAHAIPIYHASLIWPFSVEDTFDSYRTTFGGEDPLGDASGLCPSDTAGTTAKSLLMRVASDTRNAIEKPILADAPEAKVRKKRWLDQFWCLPGEACASRVLRGFGGYRGPKSGRSWGVAIDLGCGHRCRIDDAQYRAFFRARYRAAVHATVDWMAVVADANRKVTR